MSVVEDKVKDVIDIEVKGPGLHHATGKKKVPPYIVDKIEKLFTEAAEDKSKAILLKGELDRWDLYMLYEDRFLDLFRKEQ
jgi:hypothetical protein